MTAQLATINRDQTNIVMASNRPMGLTPQNIDEALRMADIMAKASIVPKDYQGNPGNILVAIQWGAELGLPPLQAMQSIAVINGRPAMWGDAVIALVRGSGLLEAMHEDIGDTSATCTVKRRGEQAESRTFSLEDAKKAGLLGKQGPWIQYQKRMLQMRARAWALRDVFPDVLRGVHVAEEAQDMPSERDMGHAQVVDTTQHASRTEAVKAKLAARAAPLPVPAADSGPDLATTLKIIADAYTNEELDQAAATAKQLTSASDKATARKAFADRKAAIKAEAEAEAKAEREAIQAEDGPETQTVAEWQAEFMGGVANA
jgi:hypothetical protein